jgi:lipopolysaccharide/colanic/teichoic acid biosynthesis glycosyltransferase
LAPTFYAKVGKRILDLALVVPGLLLAAPLIAVTAALTWVFLGSPVLFRQQRPGRNGEPFTNLKFRTMLERRDERGCLLPDERRLTRYGKLLRVTSLDELPELINVLKGDMSLVGPRPLLTQYLERYTPEQARRHHVRPGITGWAQVRGRNLLSWEKRFELDVWYVDHCSLRLDVWILVLTLWTVLKREGITAEGHVSMHEFMGSGKPDDQREAERRPGKEGRIR